MKNLFTHTIYLFFLGMFICLGSTLAQSNNEEEITLSIKAGSSKELSSLFENNVELNINGNEGDYSKNQAELIIRDFFKKFPPADFDIVHKGKSGNQINYFIGTYKSAGSNFRMLIKCKAVKGENRIYSMDINKE
ncbi:hypothetical protein GCM10028791_17810 [Echinicola sediminis]